jgi:hypothetical protein
VEDLLDAIMRQCDLDGAPLSKMKNNVKLALDGMEGVSKTIGLRK